MPVTLAFLVPGVPPRVAFPRENSLLRDVTKLWHGGGGRCVRGVPVNCDYESPPGCTPHDVRTPGSQPQQVCSLLKLRPEMSFILPETLVQNATADENPNPVPFTTLECNDFVVCQLCVSCRAVAPGVPWCTLRSSPGAASSSSR